MQRHLSNHHPEILTEFQKLVEARNLAERGEAVCGMTSVPVAFCPALPHDTFSTMLVNTT
jgi:hypothetical protein